MSDLNYMANYIVLLTKTLLLSIFLCLVFPEFYCHTSLLI